MRIFSHILSMRGKLVWRSSMSNRLCPGIDSCTWSDRPTANVVCQLRELSKLPLAKLILNLNTCIAGLAPNLAPRCPGLDSVLGAICRSSLSVLFSVSRGFFLGYIGYSSATPVFFSTTSIISRLLRYFIAYSGFPLTLKSKTSFDLL